MKNFFLVFFLFTVGIIKAQFSYGAKAGLVVSTIEVGKTLPINPESKFTYAIGAFSEYKFSDFSLNLGVSYGEFGSKGLFVRVSDDPNSDNPNVNFNESMIILDLTANYYISNNLSVGAGSYYGYISNVEYDVSNYGNINMTDEYKNSDFGVLFKINYFLYKGLFTEVKYNLGLVNIYKETKFSNSLPGDFIKDDVVKNRMLTLSLGYKF